MVVVVAAAIACAKSQVQQTIPGRPLNDTSE